MWTCRNPRARTAAALALACALLAAGCASRPRSNPLDPLNPDTGGGPTGFVAVAGNAHVSLRWQTPAIAARLGGLLLERRVHGDSTYAPLGAPLPPLDTAYDDAQVANDTDYDYRLSFLLPGGAVTGAQVERRARPGPEVVWVTDPGLDEIVRLSPDGRARVLTLSGPEACNRVAVQLSGGQVWGASPLIGVLRQFAVDGTPLAGFSGLNQPNALAVDPTSSTAWICEEAPGQATVRRWTADGVLQASGPAFGLPSDLVVVPGGGAWVVDEQAARLVRIDAAGAPQDTVALPGDPRRVARNELDGSLWVTCYSTGQVVHVSATGEVLATYGGFAAPYGVDVDEFRGTVWVGLDGAGALVALRATDGSEVTRVSNVSHPRSVTVNDRTGECFVTAIAAHELVRVAADGTVLWRNPDFEAPFDVKLDPGPR